MENSSTSSSEELHSIEEHDHNIPFLYSDPLLLTGIMKDVMLNNKEEVKRKISLGKSVRVIDNNGKSLLHLAVQATRDDMSMLDLLLEQEEIDINAADFTASTPLMDSILQEKSSVAIHLLKAGANVNIPESNTPLHFSIKKGLPDICEALIEAGADINAKDPDGDTPLHLAIYFNQFEIMCMLLCYGPEMILNARFRPLTFSIALGNFDYADILLDYETEFDADIVEYAVINEYPNLELLLSKIVENHKKFYLSPSIRFSDLLDNVNAFEIIWKNFHIEDNFNAVTQCVLTHKYKDMDFIRIVNILKKSKQSVMRKLVNYSWKKPFLSQLILNLPCEDSTLAIYEVCAIFLSHGLEVWDNDLDVVYAKYGFCKLFQLLLHMDIRFSHHEKLMVTPALYYLIDDSTRFREKVDKICCFVVESVYSHRTLLSTDYELLSRLTILPQNQLFRRSDLLSEVPKLTELARNELSYYLCSRNNIKTSSQFYTLVKTLPFPDFVKKIISLETPLYKQMIPLDVNDENSLNILNMFRLYT